MRIVSGTVAGDVRSPEFAAYEAGVKSLQLTFDGDDAEGQQGFPGTCFGLGSHPPSVQANKEAERFLRLAVYGVDVRACLDRVAIRHLLALTV